MAQGCFPIKPIDAEPQISGGYAPIALTGDEILNLFRRDNRAAGHIWGNFFAKYLGKSWLDSPAKISWCERGESNPHPLRDQILSLARLPIPPLSHTST